MDANRDTRISKGLSYLLRHGALKEKLHIDKSGYVTVPEILLNNRMRSLRATTVDIARIVGANDKKRFQLTEENGVTKIRATQGHSIKSIDNDKLLTRVTHYEHKDLVHGTTLANCKLILESGFLKKMNRNHIHLSFDILRKSTGTAISKTDVISGMRYNSHVYLYIDHSRLLNNTTGNADQQFELFKSDENEVYLVGKDIPVSYFQKVVVNRGNIRSNMDTSALDQLCQKNKIPLEYISA